MADSKLITAIGEELECPVCAEYFTDACFLSCMHSFCRSCLVKCDKTYGRGGKASMNCPLCRKVTLLGKNGVAGLSTDYTSNKLVARLKESIKEREAGYSKKDAMTCQNCRDGVVVSYCLSCCHFICANCHSIHSKMIAMKMHEVIPLKDLRKGNVTVLRTENPQFCSVHRLDTICFCYTCQRYQCEICCMLDRNREGHSCTEPSHNQDSESIVKKKKAVIEKAVERLSQKRSSLEEQQGEVKRMRASIKRHYGAMKDQLKSTLDLRIRTVTRVMTEKHDDLVKVIEDDQQVMLAKIASVDESLGHTESRTLEAKSIGDNALKDGQHAEIAAVNDYLKSVVSSLEEDKTPENALKQIKQYADKVKLNPVPADENVESLASLGDIFRPHVWEDIEVSGVFLEDTLKAMCYNASLESFVASSKDSLSKISLDGEASHIFTFEYGLSVQDIAFGKDGTTSYVLFDDNRVRLFKNQSWGKYSGVIEVPQKGRDCTLSSLSINENGVVVVGDQAARTIVGCSRAVFSRMTDISPIKMTFTSNGELAVVCRNIGRIDDNSSSRWNEAGVSVKIFGMNDRKENILEQNNWQAAAVASRAEYDNKAGRFFALGIYLMGDGRQLASLAEYDGFGTKHDVVFEDKVLPSNLAVAPLLAADDEGKTIAVYTGSNMWIYRKRDFSSI
ncbi:E3 ubiquitin-protein ligase TRIM23-like [Lytechinus variegatus]|uniref:E3 ubiquitin-protein ligase TRIM23-like n=1 Tax=Lytechinus variegatus TaxID=7654 RepID=UPI001BB20188|nr:E3 ubiquitin-protein ligase TRIM23-like [Lytechinus variegatus]